ncbi:MAG: response regulator transcription factor [Lachnospiraceae bacterium]|nr:response regulator transcription factor [Lachnospiraceae bacterium]
MVKLSPTSPRRQKLSNCSKILIVDDDVTIGNMVQEALESEGYMALRAYSGTEALMVIEKENPDLILLDLMLPGLTGEEVLAKTKDIPVIVVSAKTDIEGKVKLLYEGAADYITKPFVISELIARIAVALRMSKAQAASGSSADESVNDNIIEACGVSLDTELNIANISGTEITLTRTEAAILNILMINAERPLGRNTILVRIADSTPDCTERSLKQHISNIRKKLEAADGIDHIEAVYGIGFRFK